MSELPPEVAVEHEPTDADPPPEAIRPDRPRIWPEEPRPPRPQIKRPMEDWLAEFEQRVRDQPASGRESPTRRRRPRGLARIVPAIQPERARPQAVPTQGGEQRRGRRRRRGGGGRAEGASAAQEQVTTAKPGPARQPRPQHQPPRQGRRRGGPRPPATADGAPRDSRPSDGPRPSTPRDGDPNQAHRRRRRRGRGRGRPGGGGAPNPGGAAPDQPPSG